MVYFLTRYWFGLLITCLVVALGTSTSLAQDIPSGAQFLEQIRSETNLQDFSEGPDAASSFRNVVNRVVMWGKMLIIPLCIIFFIWGAVELLFSRGQGSSIKAVRLQVIAAAVGFVIILFADTLVDQLFFGTTGEIAMGNPDEGRIRRFASRLYLEAAGLVDFITMFAVAVALVILLLAAFQLIFGAENDDNRQQLIRRILGSTLGIVMILTAKRIVEYFFVTPTSDNTDLGLPDTQAILTEFIGWLNYSLSFIALFSVLSIIGAGIYMILHFGDDQRIESAKKAIIYALIGLVVAFTSWALTQFILLV